MIGIKSFVYAEQQRLAKFEAYWRIEHETDPEDFPSELSAGEWEEQYACWFGEEEWEVMYANQTDAKILTESASVSP